MNFLVHTAAPPSQPQKPGLHYNGTHIILCFELPFSHLAITAFNISMATTCGITYENHIVTTDLLGPIAVSDIDTTLVCQPANFSITAQSDAGISQPSPPTTFDGKPICI